MSTKIESLILSANARLRALEDGQIAFLNNILDQAFKELQRRFIKAYEQGEGSLEKTLILKGMIAELSEYLILINPTSEAKYRKSLTELLTKASEAGLDLSDAVYSEIDSERPLINAGVNLEAVTFAVENSWNRLKNHTENFKSSAISTIGYHLSIGSGARKTANDLKKLLGITKTNAETIARTETLSALNEAANLFYENNEIEYVQLFATADERLCVYCGARNQSIYKRGEIVVPLHPRCRCFLSPVRPEWLKNDLLDKDFSERFYQEGKRQAPRFDNGVAPFEKAAGQTQPPVPVWKPGDDQPFPTLVKPKAPKKTAKTTKTSTKPKQTINYRVDREDYKQLINLGEQYFKQNFEDPKKDPQLKSAVKEYEDIKKKLIDAQKTGEFSPELINDFLTAEKRVEELKTSNSFVNSMDKLRESIINKGGISQATARSQVEFLNTSQIDFSKLPVNRDQLLNIYADIYRFTGGKGLNRLSRLVFDKDRAYSGGNKINVGNTAKESTQWHEYFHQIEDNSTNNFVIATEAWVRSRAESNIPKSLNSIMGVTYFGESEIAFPDKFISPYVGKFYGENAGTEVLSMGGERFVNAEAMARLYKDDKEHFMLTLGAIVSED